MGPRPTIWSVVVAGGAGTRFGSLKQFALLAGRPVLSWSVDACRRVSEGVVLVVPAGRADDAFGADAVVEGGSTRSASVRQGLAAVPPDAEVVVVHDAARPLAAPRLFDAVLDALVPGVDGALPGLPLTDTVKRVVGVDGDEMDGAVLGDVAATVERAGLVVVQTPQAFRADVLRRAHAAGGDGTDDASLVEALGATVRVVWGDAANVKLTAPADLAYADHLLAR
jgi:2-C-methyl-D-erythritol 4-phosphate cytidylyltransferase